MPRAGGTAVEETARDEAAGAAVAPTDRLAVIEPVVLPPEPEAVAWWSAPAPAAEPAAAPDLSPATELFDRSPAVRSVSSRVSGRREAAARPDAPDRGTRLTRRGRLVLLAVGALVLAGLLTVLAQGAGQPPRAAVATNTPAVIVVQPGDTLWDIAERIAPDRDPRLVVADLRRLNSLSTADLAVGQRLRVRAP